MPSMSGFGSKSLEADIHSGFAQDTIAHSLFWSAISGGCCVYCRSARCIEDIAEGVG